MQYSYGTVTAPALLSETADLAAPQLLGWHLTTQIDGVVTTVELTEVEAYRFDDPASHSFGGPRGRNLVMFERPGLLYVYRSYGIHWCANVVCGPEGVGSAILFRAGRPTAGEEEMARRRGRSINLARGPGNLCQALGINGAHYGVDLMEANAPIRLIPGTEMLSYRRTSRIGISKAQDRLWRFLADERSTNGD
ncbi:DNA-3-methyladenine glycosylase [soil metagenome]